MAEQLSFDDKVNGLAKYWREVAAIDSEIRDDVQPLFYSSVHVLDGLRKALDSLVQDVGNHARMAYESGGFSKMNLREDSEYERQERIGILTMMTAPESPEAFYERAEKVEEFLGKILSGDEIAIRKHGYGPHMFSSQTVKVDTARDIYTTFHRNITGRDLRIMYDSPDEFDVQDQQPAEWALIIGLPVMFDDVVTYPQNRVV